MKRLCWFLGLIFISLISNGQYTNQKKASYWKMDSIIPSPKFPLEHFILPVAMITYGVIALNNDALRDLDENTQEEIWSDHPHNHTTVDNYLQFVPAAMVYGLNIAGIHGEHDLLDRTSLFVMSNIFLNITVSSLKSITMKLRPDSADYLSFPSGHTAEAFANAEFLRLEYRHKSVWYGVAGYVIAGFTGYLRMYNNKHFLSDVIAGAGIGILSTDLSYWLYPKIKRAFVQHGVKNAIVLPFYQRSVAGLSLSYQLP
jgi:membrane-associated phospholipid phosphatase